MRPQHNAHLVDHSPWPFLSSFSLLYITLGAASLFHFYIKGASLLNFGLILLIIILAFWWRDVIREGTFTFHHTPLVQKNLRLGMVLFIVSEIMFFLHFFGPSFILV